MPVQCSKKAALATLFLGAVLYILFQAILNHYAALIFVWDELDFMHKLDPEPDVLIQERFAHRWDYFMTPEERDEMKLVEYRESRITELEDGVWHNFDLDRVVAPVKNASLHAEVNNLPMIMWWTPFTGERGRLKRCFVGDCFFTENRSYTNHPLMQAFMFYGTSFDVEDLPIPRKARHEWAVLHEESPKNQALFYQGDMLELFNHTSTFKQESDYPISTQYIPSIEYLLHPLQFTTAEKDNYKVKENISAVLFIQSTCNPPSDRDVYVQELMKHIRVDSYGKCLNNREIPEYINSPLMMHDGHFRDWVKKYKFTIAIENAICNDYMTEKLFRTMSAGSVPIYKGAPNIRDWLPNNHSVILVDDFKNPKALADYVKYLDANPAEYEKYLEYKSKGIENVKLLKTIQRRPWGVNSEHEISFITGFECHVCDQIHRNRKRVGEGKQPLLHVASVSHYGCPRPVQYDDLPPVVDAEGWERDTWLWEYDDSARRASELKRRVLASRVD